MESFHGEGTAETTGADGREFGGADEGFSVGNTVN